MKFISNYCICFLFCINLMYAQKQLSSQIDQILKNPNNDIENSIVKFKNLLIQYKKSSNSVEMGVLYIELGRKLYDKNEANEAIVSFKKAISILNNHKKNHLEILNRARNNLAWVYYFKNREEEQYQILKQIEKDKGNDEYTFNAIINMAIIESSKGDYFSGLNKLNVLLTKNNNLNKEQLIRINIIAIYAKMYESDSNAKLNADLEIIKKHHKKIEDNFNQTNLNEIELFNTYNNLANFYEAFGDFNRAIKLYTKAKKYYKEQGDISNMLDVMNNLGYVYAKLDKHQIASTYFDEVIYKTDDIYQKATAYNNKGYFLKAKSSLQKIPYFQKAIQTILERNDAVFTIPSLDLIRNSGYQQDVLIYCIDLAYHYVEAYKETKNKTYLVQAKETLHRIDELVSLIRYESNTEQSKLFWIEKGVNTYMLATEVCYLLNKPDDAFYFMEKNKALLLQENIKVFQAKLELEIPKEIQEREYKLHYELQALEKQIQNGSNDALLKLKYSFKNKEFQVFMDSLRKKYPEYTKVKQQIETISINKVIKSLTKEECFITYILNQNDGYGIFCNKKEKIFFKIANTSIFQSELKVLKDYMRQRLLAKKDMVVFQKLSNSIFKTLFPFKDAFTKIKERKIVIIPDDTLLDLPFEALAVSSTQSLSKSYLINYTEISYLQSFSVFEKIKQKQNKASKKLFAIAPCQFSDKKLPDLIRSKEAMSALNLYSSSEILIGKEATKENFYTKSLEYEILHLNTHAGIDSLSNTPWILFRNDKLTLDELYGINSQAELVILDACKTNDGEFASGEGILSLSRGFFNNGSKSVLASLWNVNEKAGNEIIATFYSQLERGKSKSKALQLAKINYLKKHQFSEVMPYYWASFTLTGSTQPIELSKNYFQGTPLLIIISSLMILIGFICYKRKLFFTK